MNGKTTSTEESDMVPREFIESLPLHFAVRGYAMIILITLGLLTLSIIIKYPIIAEGTVKITTLIPPESIALSEGGIIEKLQIKNGEVVSTNQTLFVLRSDANYQDVSFAKNLLNTLHFRQGKHFTKAQLYEDVEIFDKLNDLKLGSLRTDLIVVKNQFSNFIRIRNIDLQKTKLASLGERKKEMVKNLEVLEKTNSHIIQELSLAQQNEERYQQLFMRGVVSEIDFENARKQTLSIEQKLNNNFINISSSIDQSSIYRTDEKLVGLNYDLEKDRALNLLTTSIDRLYTAIESWETLHLIKARSEGRVHFLKRINDNSIVDANQKIIIVENLNYTREVVAEIMLTPSNYGSVSLGQDVEVKLDSYPESEFGFLRGKVIEISEVPNEDSKYIVVASFINGLITTTNREISYRDEMMGSCRILTKNMSLLKRLFYSLK